MTDKETIAFMLDVMRSTRELIVYGCDPSLSEYQKQVMKRLGIAAALAQDALNKPEAGSDIIIFDYEDFDSWFEEIENYGTRAERFYCSLESFHSEEGRVANGRMWLEAAFASGRSLA